MADNVANITDEEAGELIGMEKRFLDSEFHSISVPACNLEAEYDLISEDGTERFVLDLGCGFVEFKIKEQLRSKRVTHPLIRLDTYPRARHVNPDGEAITGPHIHIYRDGTSAWAYPVPADKFSDLKNPSQTLYDFLTYCNIKHKLDIQTKLVIK